MEAKQQTRKDLYLSLILVACSFAMLLGATIAWFGMNKDVDADSMNSAMKYNPSLVVGTQAGIYFSDESILLSDIINPKEYYLKPSTHDDAIGYSNDGAKTGLKFVTTPKTVSPSTGLIGSSEVTSKTYQPVPEYNSNQARRYYCDYDVYLSSENKTMTVDYFYAGLVYTPVAISAPKTLADVSGTALYIKASSVDFYIDGASSKSDYVGTLNLAGIDITSAAAVQAENQFVWLDLAPAIETKTGKKEIPLVKDGSIHVILRFYFDGALQVPGLGKAYITSNLFEIEDFRIAVKFEAIEPVED